MRSILAFLFIALAGIAARASTAVFSKDAKYLFLLKEQSARFVEIDIAAKTFRLIDLTGTTNDELHDLAMSNSGFILCTATDAVWSFDPATGKCVKVCANPKGVELRVIACDPVTGAVVVAGAGTPPDQPESAGWPAYYLAKGSNALERIRARYGSTLGYPAFAPDGTLYFEMNGDLWSGKIGDTIDGDDGPFRPLIACRCAPLASLIDEDTSPPSTGLQWFAATGHFMYASVARMGGSGWGDIIRFPRPPCPVEGNGDDAEVPVELLDGINSLNSSPL